MLDRNGNNAPTPTPTPAQWRAAIDEADVSARILVAVLRGAPLTTRARLRAARALRVAGLLACEHEDAPAA